jgi:hypothetical protein
MHCAQATIPGDKTILALFLAGLSNKNPNHTFKTATETATNGQDSV